MRKLDAWDEAFLIYMYGTKMGTLHDIARVFGVSFGAVNSKLYRLRKKNPVVRRMARRIDARQ